MSTPASSKPQQKKTKASKKVSAKGLKNVLALPDDNFCPRLKNDPGAGLENLLKRLLPALKRDEKKKIPWSTLRTMSKEERSAARKAARIECNTNCDEAIFNSIKLGINATTKLLEKNDACCILLDGTFEPSVLIKHVIAMARCKNIPILVVSFLKKATLETIGFACAAIGIRSHVKDLLDNHFNALYSKVLELSQEFITSNNGESFKNELDDTSKAPNIASTNGDAVELQKMEIDTSDNIKPRTVSTDPYLYRKSTNERVFQPPNVSKNSQQTKESQNSEYITFNTNDSDEDAVESLVRPKLYHSLRVNRLKGNENRKKSGKLKVKK